MVDAGSDFAVPLYSGESNVAVGASSTPIHVAALVVQIGRGHWLFRESLHPRFSFSYTNSALKTTRAEDRHIDERELGRCCLASPMSAAIIPRGPQIVDQDIDADQKHPNGQYGKTPADEGAADQKHQCQ